MIEGEQDGSGTWLPLRFRLNGDLLEVVVPADRRLVELLRDDLGLTGTKVGCDVGVCGACTVLVEERPTSSCITLAAQIDGQEVMTIEGVDALPAARELQAAMLQEGGLQCGFCTSGQILGLMPLLREGLRDLSREEIAAAVDGNLCRCTGYYGIFRAVERLCP